MPTVSRRKRFHVAMLHPLPYMYGALLSFFISSVIGMSAAVVFGIGSELGVGIFAITGGIVGIVIAFTSYRRFNSGWQFAIYRGLFGLWYLSFGVILGGIPGALIGHAIANDTGEIIGWFVTATILGVLAAYWGWRTSSKVTFDGDG